MSFVGICSSRASSMALESEALLVVLRTIVFERSLFDFIYILRIGFVGSLSFRNNEN